MQTVPVTLTDDEYAAYTARVAWLQQQAAMDPPPFPPVMSVADVQELVQSYYVSFTASIMNWYLTQVG
jgi:hypothetical protein